MCIASQVADVVRCATARRYARFKAAWLLWCFCNLTGNAARCFHYTVSVPQLTKRMISRDMNLNSDDRRQHRMIPASFWLRYCAWWPTAGVSLAEADC
eukprot:6196170-Pleurochrysis_carterae.AAC.5